MRESVKEAAWEGVEESGQDLWPWRTYLQVGRRQLATLILYLSPGELSALTTQNRSRQRHHDLAKYNFFAGNAQCYSELFRHIRNCPNKLKTLWMTHQDPDKIKIIWRDSKVWYWSVGMTETIWAKLTGDPLRQVGACVWLPNLAGTNPCHRGTDPNSPTRVNKLKHTKLVLEY